MDKGKEDDQGSRKILRNRKYLFVEEKNRKIGEQKREHIGEGKYLEKKKFGLLKRRKIFCSRGEEKRGTKSRKSARIRNSEFTPTSSILPLSKGLEGISDLHCSCSCHREYRRSAPRSSDAEF